MLHFTLNCLSCVCVCDVSELFVNRIKNIATAGLTERADAREYAYRTI